jgi:hypothetical protein
VSPLAKYYLALAIFVAVIVVPQIVPDSASGAAIVIGFGIAACCWVYMMFVARCPNCGYRLSRSHTACSHGLPGRYCQSCEYDLMNGKPASNSAGPSN